MTKQLLLLCGIIIGFTKLQAQEINPFLVGTNVWLNPSSESWATVGELGNVGMIRIGGNAPNQNFPSNSQLMTWVKDIRAIGGEPLIQISQHQTPAEAAAVIEYFNITQTETDPIKYWNIGNEPILDLGLTSENISASAETVVEYFKPLAEAMKEVDPTIKIFGPDYCYYITSGFEDLLAADGSNNDISGKIPGKEYYYLDGIAWHKYPQISEGMDYDGYNQFKSDIEKAVTLINATNAAQNRTGEDAIQWGIGEYNAKGGEQVHTWENGQMFGGVLGLAMKHKATYMCTWSIFEHDGDRTGTDFSMIDGTNMAPRATYWHMHMIGNNFSGNYLDGTSSDSDILFYGCEDNGKVSIMIINRKDLEPVFYSLNLNGTDASNDKVQLTLNAGENLNINGVISADVTQLLVIENGVITKTEYSKYDFENEIEPNSGVYNEPASTPAVPINLSAQATSYNAIQLSWNIEAGENVQNFLLYRKLSEETEFALIGQVNGELTSHTDNLLSPETTYDYKVRALNGLGYSDFSATTSATTESEPAPEAYNGPHVIPGTIEIEDFNLNGEGIGYHDEEAENKGGKYRITEGVDIEECSDTNGGYNIGYINEGEWVKYLISSVQEGNYDIEVRFASNKDDATQLIEVYLDDQLLGTLTPYNTLGWQNWETLTLENITLTGGSDKILKLLFKGSGYNLNNITVSDTDSSIKLNEADSREMVKVIYDNSLNRVSVEIDEKLRNGHLYIYDISGKKVLSQKYNQLINGSFSFTPKTKGTYIITVNNEKWISTQKIVL